MGRALANLEDDRAGSIAILENAHRLFPSDGSLADHFFPSLRRVGLMEQHDKWFEISWNRVNDVIAEYPTSDNSRNTAGWLASRARRHLPEAEKHLQEALALSPRQWSQRAVNFMPLDPMLRRQQERFRTAPLPR